MIFPPYFYRPHLANLTKQKIPIGADWQHRFSKIFLFGQNFYPLLAAIGISDFTIIFDLAAKPLYCRANLCVYAGRTRTGAVTVARIHFPGRLA
jgi:hypothetical protein